MGVTSYSGHKGETITLSCRGNTDPTKATPQLLPYITIEWVGPKGTALTKENGITFRHPQRGNTNLVVSTLTISGTNYSHTGEYSCIVTLNRTTDSPSAHSEFHLTLKRKAASCSIALNCFTAIFFLQKTLHSTSQSKSSVRHSMKSVLWSACGVVPLISTRWSGSS